MMIRMRKQRKANDRAVDDQVRKFQRALDSLPDEQSKNILSKGRADQARKILEQKNFKNPDEILEARGYWHEYKDIPAEKETQSPGAQTTNINVGPVGTIATGAAIGTGVAFSTWRNRQYNKLIKEAEKAADDAAEKWEKNPDESFAKSEQGARNHAINEYYDRKLKENPEKLEEWAKKHNNPDIQKAIKRKEILETPNPKRDKNELEKFLQENDIKNPEKTHRPTGDISQSEASQRLEKASEVGMTKLATPAAVAAYLEGIKNEAEIQEHGTPPATAATQPENTGIHESATTDEKIERIEEVVKELENKKEVEDENRIR